MNKLKSRKLWAAIVSAVILLTGAQVSESEQAELASALGTVAIAVGYILSVALEDGLTQFGQRSEPRSTDKDNTIDRP